MSVFDLAIDLEAVRNIGLLGADEVTDERLTAQIQAASRFIRDTDPGIVERVATGEVAKDSLLDVIAEVVARRIRNPEGLRSVQRGEGPYSGEKVWAGDVDTGFYLLAREARRLGIRKSGGTQKWAAIPLGRGYAAAYS